MTSAMAHLNGWDEIEIATNNNRKIETYLKDYLPFHENFKDIASKKVDEALWAYGKFLSQKYSMI